MTNVGITDVRGNWLLAASRRLGDLLNGTATRISSRIHAVKRAQERAGTVATLADETLKDLSVAPDDILGHVLWQEDLPFFMQGRFGKD